MIICTKCGYRNADTESFCAQCGSFLEWTGQRVSDGTPEPPAPPPSEPETPARRGIVSKAKAALGLEGETDEDAATVDGGTATASAAAGASAPEPDVVAVPAPPALPMPEAQPVVVTSRVVRASAESVAEPREAERSAGAAAPETAVEAAAATEIAAARETDNVAPVVAPPVAPTAAAASPAVTAPAPVAAPDEAAARDDVQAAATAPAIARPTPGPTPATHEPPGPAAPVPQHTPIPEAPARAAPVAPAPVPAPAWPGPIATTPAAAPVAQPVPQPAAAQPAAAQPPATKPVKPVAPQPAPVRPAAPQPAAVQPAAVQPAAVPPAAPKPRVVEDQRPIETVRPGEIACASCGASNAPSRSFCHRCGASLQVAAMPRMRRPWWRRLLPGGKPREVAAGERPKRLAADAADTGGRHVGLALRNVVGLVIVAAVAGGGASYLAVPGVRDAVNGAIDQVRMQVAPRFEAVHTDGRAEGPTDAAKTHAAQAAFDGFSNTWWSAPSAGSPTITAHFSPSTDVGKILITAGNADDFQSEQRPKTMVIEFLDANGKTVDSREIQLSDTAKPQTFDVSAKAAAVVKLTIKETYASVKSQSVAIAEVEFFARR